MCKKEEVLKTYEDFYQNLFKSPPRDYTRNQEVQKELGCIQEVAKKQEPLKIEKEDVEEVICKLKKKKAEDYSGWKNELMIFGGDEMTKSLVMMYNNITEQLTIPNQWNNVIIKSFYKNKGSKMEMKNRRGIFLTNLSKVFETIILKKDTSEMYSWQNGGRKKRSAIDNILMIMGVIDNNRRLKRKTYIYTLTQKNALTSFGLRIA